MAQSGLWLYRKNGSHVLDATVRNSLAPGYIVTATVTVTLTDTTTGLPLSGETWPVTLAFVTGSDRLYRATLSHALVVTTGQRFTGALTVTSGALQRVIVHQGMVVLDDGL